MCVNLGHKNPAVVASIAAQAEQLAYAMPGYATEARAELSQLLLDVLPAGLNKFFFTTSGTEANEAAFKIARMYTGKTKIIARYRSYHGSTMASIAATGDPRRWAMEPGGKGQGFVFAPEVNCYKCPIHHTYPGCGIACAEYLEHMIRNESDVAAVIVEPVVGTNGVLVPPPEYMPMLREICTRHKVLLIADEVMSGWGRTGAWFAVDNWGVKPDILVTAKGITSAYVPLGPLRHDRGNRCVLRRPLFLARAHVRGAPHHAGAGRRDHSRDAAAGPGEPRAQNGRDPGAEAARAEGEASLHRRSAGARTLLGARSGEESRDERAFQHAWAQKVDGTPLVVDKVAADMLKRGIAIQAWVSHLIVAPPLIVEEADLDFAVAALDGALAHCGRGDCRIMRGDQRPGTRMVRPAESALDRYAILRRPTPMPGWRNWQTQRTQNRLTRNQILYKQLNINGLF